MADPLTRAEAEAFFGPEGLARVPADRLPAGVTDPGARAFLTGIGLPTAPISVVVPDEGLAGGTPVCLADRYPGSWEKPSRGLPPRCGAWLVVGHAGEWPFVLDGATGAVHVVSQDPPEEIVARPVHRDLHSLVRCVMALRPEILRFMPLDGEQEDWCAAHVPGWADLDEETLDHEAVLDRVVADLEAAEPGVTAQPVWSNILDNLRYGF